jgi:DeoR/GlpR family transcriptional regulator of sugar metabolism
MQKRNTQQRRNHIIDCLDHDGEVMVDGLAKRFSTSKVTIRKDLAALERDGLLVRTFGGAVMVSKPIDTSACISSGKRAIAELAATLINDNGRIVIDSGSTTAAMIPAIKDKQSLVVMTNSLKVANSLLEGEHPPKILMTGGTWDPQSDSFQGQMAEKLLGEYNFDQAFLGAAGLDVAKGSTTFNELTSVSRVMADVSTQVIVLAESNKLQHKIPNIELPWSAISILVTDSKLDKKSQQQIEQQGVQVLCAKTELVGNELCVEL